MIYRLAVSILASLVFLPTTVMAEYLRIGMAGSWLNDVHPLKARSRIERSVTASVFEALVDVTKDGRIVPKLAEMWEVSNEGEKVTFGLRKDVSFSDGTPLTASIVVAAMNASGRLPDVELSNLDDYTLVLRSQYQPDFFIDISQIPIFLSEDQTGLNRPLGTGPFMVQEFKPTEAAWLKAVENYWGGTPAWTSVEYRPLGFDYEGTVRDLLFDFQVVELGSSSNVTELVLDQSVRVFETIVPRNYYLAINPASEVLSNPKVRQAISTALDRRRIASASASWLRPTRRIAPPLTSIIGESTEGFSADEEAARELIEKEVGSISRAITLRYRSSTIPKSIAAQITEDLSKIGISVTPVEKPSEGYWPSLRSDKGNLREDMVLVTWSGQDFSQIAFDAFSSGSPFNFLGYSTPEADNLIQTAANTFDVAKRQSAYQDIESFFQNEAIFVPLLKDGGLWATDTSVSEIQVDRFQRLAASNVFRPDFEGTNPKACNSSHKCCEDDDGDKCCEDAGNDCPNNC